MLHEGAIGDRNLQRASDGLHDVMVIWYFLILLIRLCELIRKSIGNEHGDESESRPDAYQSIQFFFKLRRCSCVNKGVLRVPIDCEVLEAYQLRQTNLESANTIYMNRSISVPYELSAR